MIELNFFNFHSSRFLSSNLGLNLIFVAWVFESKVQRSALIKRNSKNHATKIKFSPRFEERNLDEWKFRQKTRNISKRYFFSNQFQQRLKHNCTTVSLPCLLSEFEHEYKYSSRFRSTLIINFVPFIIRYFPLSTDFWTFSFAIPYLCNLYSFTLVSYQARYIYVILPL